MAARQGQVVAKKQQHLAAMVADAERPSFSVKDQQLMMTKNGKTIVFSPNGQQYSYHSASLSPDGQKVAYYVAAVGCFVCNIDGSNVQFIAHNCYSPVWYNNQIIIASDSKDNGHFITESAIVAYSLQGEKQILVNKETMAIYPYAADGKIAFSTAAGKVYVMNVK
jgi:hypothetical protein